MKLTGIRVMIVDDSMTIRKIGESTIKDAGGETLSCCDGFEAVAKVAAYKPDVIVADLMMPKLDGFGLCAIIKRNPALRSIPVIILTSKSGTFDEARGKMAGANRYLTKPLGKSELINTIALCVGRG